MLKYENQIKRVLRKINMANIKYVGYNYTVFCVNNIMEQLDNNDDKPSIIVAYQECANYFPRNKKNSRQNVEHAVRTFKEHASYEYKKMYNPTNPIETNTVFLYNLVQLVREADTESKSLFEKLARIDKEEDLYFLLTNNRGYVTIHDIEKTAMIMGKIINTDKDLIDFAITKCPGIYDVYSSSELTPEDFLKYNQKYLAIRFCTKEFGISIVEAKNLIESVLEG